MRRIHYANDVIVTADRVADAVLAYARQLAIHHTSDTVSIPVLADDGHIGSSMLLLGPASQISSNELRSTDTDIAGFDDRFPEPPYFPTTVGTHGYANRTNQTFEQDMELAETLRYFEGS
jgi:hypothetical protein